MGRFDLDNTKDSATTAPNRSGSMRLGLKLGMLIIATSLMAGCVTTSSTPAEPKPIEQVDDVNDPLEPVNRVFFEFNRGLDTLLLRPIATLYRGLTPPPLQTIVHNFLNNLKAPVILLNDLLQGEIARAGDTIVRFAINTT
ncbi:MAG: VacJ family lipoprotein, partial [Magnetovibrio sp.]|nr:VacJ family lipoprotein [Magnetovibrio sp.]